MSKRNLIVAVREADYIERLAEYVRRSPFGDDWQMTAFTNPMALKQFVRGGYGIDLIAAQPAMLEELGDTAPNAPTALLVDRTGRHGDRSEVLQYQPLPQLLQTLLSVHAGVSGEYARARANKNGAAVVAVYSPVGGIGKTTLALHLAQQAGIRGVRVFYLNLEQWNATSVWLGDEGPEDLSMMLYVLQTRPDFAARRLPELRKRHPTLGFDYFAPSGNPDEQLSISGELTQRLLEAIAGSGEYELVVVDLDSRLGDSGRTAIQASDVALWLLPGDSCGERKTELALRYAEQKWGADFADLRRRFCFVNALRASGKTSGPGTSKLRAEAELPFVPAWSGAGRPGEWGGSPEYRGAVESLLRRLPMPERSDEHAGGSLRPAQA